MLFNSIQYLIFLPVVLALYWLSALRFRLPILLIASYELGADWNYGPTRSKGLVRHSGCWYVGNPVLGGNIDTANGSVADVNDNTNIDYTLANMMLIGYTGNPPILPYGHQAGAISGDPHFIPSGNTLLNYPINYTGPISLACNDKPGSTWQP